MSEQDPREILGTRKRNVTLTFDLKDQNEREVYEWFNEQADNGSTFIKQVLSQYKEYQKFVQTVSKLHEMMPMMQQMFPMGANSNPIMNPLQQMSSQVNQQVQQPFSKTQPFSQTQPLSQTNTTPKAATNSNPAPIPSRSARHGGGSKRRRTSMPME
ncbi:hypothetical protein [Shimazuella alba]|uniref:Uncharacterized protein n=1 Tax=Shimazuella alba TaxID=2690964 RepID=A0A6I4VWL3_9BACL|nr:hypothetical protein [Shimazuella alba]MXQ55937.1 hypothetical protein [Shimazuella alba]